jgi:hypothetical protein
MKSLLIAAALTFPTAALACGGAKTADTTEKTEVQLAAVSADATKCAQKAALVGDNCAYSTGMMAQRVHADGKDMSLTAKLAKQDQMLDSHVAAPFTVGEGMYVIANEVIEQADSDKQLALTGKALEVDGIKYFLVTGFQPASS